MIIGLRETGFAAVVQGVRVSIIAKYTIGSVTLPSSASTWHFAGGD